MSDAFKYAIRAFNFFMSVHTTPSVCFRKSEPLQSLVTYPKPIISETPDEISGVNSNPAADPADGHVSDLYGSLT